ncbi:hypothetical protein ACYPKM_01710 [Pseudomonas aeruginosa]
MAYEEETKGSWKVFGILSFRNFVFILMAIIVCFFVMSVVESDKYYKRLYAIGEKSPTHQYVARSLARCQMYDQKKSWSECTVIAVTAGKIAGYSEELLIQAVRDASEIERPAQVFGYYDN